MKHIDVDITIAALSQLVADSRDNNLTIDQYRDMLAYLEATIDILKRNIPKEINP